MAIELINNKTKLLNSEESPADENVQVIRGMLDQAGHIGRAAGHECIGYAVVFIYKNKFMGRQGEFRCHSELKMASEVTANDAFKALGIHMGKKFGRNPRKV